MPEFTVIQIGLFALMLVIGGILGWLFRADRCAREKIAVNASWQEQFESQQSEHNRLAEQNKSLMEQISQYQASQKDYSNRAKELSESLREAFVRRDELQRQLKDMRGNLEVAIAHRDHLKAKLQSNPVESAAALREKDEKIFKLSRELTSWQSRVPPLVERFQDKDREARTLEEELARVRTRIRALEELVKSDQTRIEPVDAASLPDGGDASNEPIAMGSSQETAAIQDQIDDHADAAPAHDIVPVEDFVAPPEGDDRLLESEFAGNGRDAAEVVDIGTADDKRDDLKRIKGIGPSIERTLNGLGVCRFQQLAEMSEYDIDRVAQQLKGFRSRIYREDWIGQARDLQYQKNNDYS